MKRILRAVFILLLCQWGAMLYGQNVLFVVGNTSLNSGDQAVKDRLENSLGYVVTVADDNGIQASAANGQDLILISSTVSSNNVGATFVNSTLPVVNYENGLYDDFGMVGGSHGTVNVDDIDIIDSSHPMAAGLSGTVQLYTSSQNVQFGEPSSANAIEIAEKAGTYHGLFFGYDQGVSMPGMVAPARRVGIGLGNGSATALTADGWALFDAAFAWALGGGSGGNQPPTASFTATPSTGNAPLTVNFDALASSDSDGSIVSYSWDFGDGTSGSGQNPAHIYTQTGNFTVVLTVTDDDGATATASQTLTIGAANSAPTASFTATPTNGNAPLSVSFDASASFDPNNDPLTYSWDFGDGNTGTGVTISHTYTTAGTYTAVLTVTDVPGATDTDSETITVTTSGGVSEAWLEAECGTIGVNWQTGTDTNASNGEYAEAVPGNNSTTNPPASPDDWVSFTFSLSQTDTYYVFGHVFPVSGGNSFWVRVDGGTWIKWNSLAATNAWTWGELKDHDNGNQTVTYALNAGGHTLDVALREDGAKLDKLWITTENTAPTGLGGTASNCSGGNQSPTASFNATPTSGNAPLTVSLDASASSDPDGTIATYDWDFGDGNSGTGVTTSYIYTTVGTFTITLTITDNQGAIATATETITVSNPGGGVSEAWLEAECGTIGANWQTGSDTNASNGEYTEAIPGNNSTTNAPTSPDDWVSFTFSLTQTDTYYVFGHVFPISGGNSFWVRVDGGTWIKWNSLPAANAWIWGELKDQNNGNQTVTYSLSAGSHTLDVALREDGAKLDKLWITTASTAPTGLGGTATNCGGASCPTSPTETAALMALYNSTGGANWTNSTNWGVGCPCEDNWFGVTCDTAGNVTQLTLNENNLIGTIPPEIENLTELENINFNFNQIRRFVR